MSEVPTEKLLKMAVLMEERLSKMISAVQLIDTEYWNPNGEFVFDPED